MNSAPETVATEPDTAEFPATLTSKATSKKLKRVKINGKIYYGDYANGTLYKPTRCQTDGPNKVIDEIRLVLIPASDDVAYDFTRKSEDSSRM